MIKNRTAQLIYQTIYCTLGLVGFVACLGIFDDINTFRWDFYVHFTNISNFLCIGVMVAALGLSPKSETGKLSSKAGFIGLAKKMFIVFFVLLGAALDAALGTTVIQSMIICMYIANEGLSIIENASLLGMPVPKALADALEVMKQKSDEHAVLKMQPRETRDPREDKPPDEV